MEISRLSPRTAWLIAILIAVLHAWMAVTAVNTKSPTFDEPQHLTAGYSYWVTNDFRLDPENGNLPAMWAALPLLFDDLKFVPLNDRGWQRAEEGRTAHQFFYEVGNDPDRMIAQARAMMSIFGAALCLFVYRIARDFFGPIGGLVATTVAAFDPNFLAHSPLVTSDVSAAFFFTATVWTCWRLFQQISPARLALATLSLSGLLLTKFSAPIVLPVLGAISIWQIFSHAEIRFRFAQFGITLRDKSKKACAIAACWLALGAILFVAIWGSCSFRYAAWTDNRASHEGTVWHWNYLLEDHGAFEKTIGFARDHRLLPEEYLYGFAYVHKHEIDRPAFLDNEWSIVGFRSFFPLAFLYKTSLPLLFLLALAIYAAIATRRSWKIENLFNPLWGFALVYGAFALSAQLNIGHRHLLPIYPTLFVACGAVVYLLRQNRRAIFAGAIALLLCAQIADSFAARPNYLAYFNQIDGGPKNGYQHLLDSSLDWGQDLPALKSWIDNHGAIVDGKPFYLAYFGTADAHYYGIDAKPISQDLSSRGRPPTRLTGGIYFVSATELQSLYAEAIGPWCVQYEDAYLAALAGLREYRSAATTRITPIGNEEPSPLARKMKKLEALQIARLFAYLRHRAPIAQISYSMFVFDLSNEELNQALYGPPVELKPSGCVRGL
jgi:hypothetical protein